MSEHDDEDVKLARLKTTHNAIETAIDSHLAEMGVGGILTGWTLAASITSIQGNDDFDGLYRTQSDGLSKWANIGMLVSALESEKNESSWEE